VAHPPPPRPVRRAGNRTRSWRYARFGAGRDQVAVHRPVHVGGERDAVARVVVAGLGEGMEVQGKRTLAQSPARIRQAR